MKQKLLAAGMSLVLTGVSLGALAEATALNGRLRITRHLSSGGEFVASKSVETEFGRGLVDAWKRAGIELPVPEEKALGFHKGVAKLSAQPEVELPDNMRFTGFLQYSDVDGVIRLPYGFYTFSQKEGLRRHLYKELQGCLNLGGAYVGNRLYGMSNIPLPYGNNPDRDFYLYQWDTDTWAPVADKERNNDLMTRAADCDPVTGKVYGITYCNSGMTELSVVDYVNKTYTPVGDLYPTCTEISAFAVGNDGCGYALCRDGGFFRVDLSSATAEKVGDLDFRFFHALQSMAFDRRTGKLYLAASEGDPDDDEAFYGRLCEVSLENASTKLVGYFPEAEEYTVLNIVYDPEPGAPGNLADLSARYESSALEGTLTFTMPLTTFGGTPMSGDVDYKVYVNDSTQPALMGTAAAGESVSCVVTPAEGRTKYVVVLSNSEGEGIRNAIESWGGNDTPAVVDVEASVVDGKVSVTWRSAGASGGFADLDGVTYRLLKYPGAVILAEGIATSSYIDDISDQPDGAFVYEVVPVKEGADLPGMRSTPVYGGTPRELPYAPDLSSEDTEYDFRMVSNNDKGWELAYDLESAGALCYNSSAYADADAWAISPAFEFEGGYTYVLNLRSSKVNPTYDEYIGVAIGEGADPSQYQTVLDRHSVKGVYGIDTEEIRVVYECRKSGAYHVGIHALSPRNQGTVMVEALSLEKGLSVDVPGAPSDVVAKAGEKGELSADVSFTAPTLKVGGAALDKVTKATLYRDDDSEPVAALEDLVPGQRYTITDADAMNGHHTYTVTVWNEIGEGDRAVADPVYVGIDSPLEPYAIEVLDNLDGTFTMTWELPATGVEGGVVDPDEVAYSVYYYRDGSLELLASEIEGCSYKVTQFKDVTQQAFLFLFVQARNEIGESRPVEAPVASIGSPYEIPFTEGFRELEGIWYPEGDEAIAWGLYQGMSTDFDDFLMGVRAKDYNQKGALRSGKFSVIGAQHPKVAFSYYAYPGADNQLSLYAVKNGCEELPIINIPFRELEGDEGWRTCIADLNALADAAYFNLLFKVAINDEDYDTLLIDDINVRDVPSHDLEVAVTPQNRVTAGKEADIDVYVHNIGSSAENSYNIAIGFNGKPLTTLDAVELPSFGRVKMTLRCPVAAVAPAESVVDAQLTDPADSRNDNNFASGVIRVTAPMLPPVSGAMAEETGDNVTLRWSEPDFSAPVKESFEGYASWKYDGFGDWKVFDGDDFDTSPVIGNYYPGYGGKASFFTCDFTTLGYDKETAADFMGNTGESFIACVRPYSFRNDDWVISPRLSGAAQTITLFAKSYGAIWPDRFKVMYSTSGTDPDDFTAVGDEAIQPESDWREYSAALPDGAQYFAIHCDSEYGGMLMIDDVIYEAACPEIIGYNIYRDGEKIASVAPDVMSYSDHYAGQSATYEVTAVYTEGESGPSGEMIVSSVILADASGLSVSSRKGLISIEGAYGKHVLVASIDGTTVFSGKAGDILNIPVVSGIYMVTVGERTVKILIF